MKNKANRHASATNPRRTQVALKASQARYFDLYDLAPVGYVTVSEPGLILEANLTATTMLGVIRSALLKQPLNHFILKEDADSYDQHRQQLFATGKPQSFELRMVKSGGTSFWTQLAVNAAQDEAGAPILRIVLSDITERQRTATALRESAEHFVNLFQKAPLGYQSLDADGRFSEVNETWLATLGYSREEVVGKWFGDFLAPEYVTAFRRRFQTFKAAGSFHSEFEMLHRSGERRFIAFEGRIGHKQDGSFQQAHCILQDITKRKRAEEAAITNETRFREIFNVSPVPMVLHDEQQNIIFLNLAFVQTFGYSREDIPTLMHWLPKAYPDLEYRLWVADTWQAELEQAQRTRAAFSPVELTVRCKNGTNKTVLGSVALLANGVEGNHLMLLYDITERKRMEEALDHQNGTLNSLLENLPMGVFMVEAPSGKTIFANRAALKLLGRNALPDATMENNAEVYQALKRPGNSPYPTEELPIILGMQGKTSHIDDMVVVRPDGGEALLEIFGSPVTDSVGKVWASLMSFSDITERKQVEAKLRGVLVELERSNQELEQFAYIASHDLQEPLRMVSSYTKLLAERYAGELDDKAQKYIHYAVDGATRMQTLINDLLAYSRVGSRARSLEPTDSLAVFGEAIQNLSVTITENRAVITNADLPTVRADASQLVLVFQNLLANAIKFRGQDRPHVHVSAQDRGHEWVFAVKDNGIGIEPQHAERVFVIFQRLHTQTEYPGTGIGLAVCQRIVTRHGGKIWFESTPGNGTTFFFTIPK